MARRCIGAESAFAAVSRRSGGYAITEREGLRDPRWGTVVVRHGRGLGGRVVAEAQPVVASDYLKDTTITADYRTIVAAEGLRTLVCVPVLAADGVTALLYVGDRTVGGLGDRAVEEVGRIAEMVGVGLQHVTQTAPLSSLAARARRALEIDDIGALRAVAQRLVNSELAPPREPRVRLTPRELDVLDLLAAGASNREIADRLFLAESTVKGYVRELRAKLDARSRLDAVARARAVGLL